MTANEARQERRAAPRVAARISLTTASEERGSFLMETVDISTSGAYCLVDRFVPLMTRVRLTMDIPGDPGDGGSADVSPVGAEGIVVRIEPERESPGQSLGYRLALFFSSIDGAGRPMLEAFIRRQQDRRREI